MIRKREGTRIPVNGGTCACKNVHGAQDAKCPSITVKTSAASAKSRHSRCAATDAPRIATNTLAKPMYERYSPHTYCWYDMPSNQLTWRNIHIAPIVFQCA